MKKHRNLLLATATLLALVLPLACASNRSNRQELTDRGIEEVSSITWSASARKVRAVYSQMLARGLRVRA